MGCDSIVTLHLTLNYSVTNEIEVESCRFYEWNGIIYDVEGDYTQTFTSIVGCDSIVTMHLTLVEKYVTEIDTTVCGSFTMNDIEYTSSGVYEQDMVSLNGCDSVVIVTLTVNPYPAEIPAINGQESVFVLTNLMTGTYSYTIDPVEYADYYEWEITGAGVDWIVESEETTCKIVVTTSGWATLTVRAWNGCGYTEQSIVINAGFFDVDQNEESQIALYPNPTPNYAYVEADDIIRVRLFSLKGQLLQEIPGNHSDRVQLNVWNLPAAVYMVEVLTPHGVANLKLDVHR